MVNSRIATSAEQPINRHAGIAKYQGEEGDLVGLNASGEVVKADADSSVAVPAVGVLLSPVDSEANYTVEAVKSTVEAYRTRPGDRVTFVKYGVEIENGDDDWNFTEGSPVYLKEGGGYTQTKPSGVGDLVQQVGVALTPERILLAVHDHHETIDYASGDASFSGDASATSFSIAHGLSAAPSEYRVTPTSADADGDYYVSVGATNITVNFAAAPAAGTDNVTFNWYAKE